MQKVVNREINRAGLADITGSGNENVQGEEQQILMLQLIRFRRAFAGVRLSSFQEEEDIIELGNDRAKYIVAIDPLDDQHRRQCVHRNHLSIYRRISPQGSPANGRCITAGPRAGSGRIYLVVINYVCLYNWKRVNGFTYEPSLGEYIFSHQNLKMLDNGKIY